MSSDVRISNTEFVARRSLRQHIEQDKTHKLTTRTVTLEEKDVQLRRKITRWWSIQEIYMPCVTRLRVPLAPANDTSADESESDESVSAVDMELFLPNELPRAEHSALPQGLIDKYL